VPQGVYTDAVDISFTYNAHEALYCQYKTRSVMGMFRYGVGLDR